MGMIVCKNCYENQFNSWVKPFDPQVTEPERLPEYNENVQHYSLYQVEETANKLQNGQMLEIICNICKMTHVAKDENGVIKVRYTGGDWQDWS